MNAIPSTHIRNRALTMGSVLLACLGLTARIHAAEIPINEKLTLAAWNSFNGEKYELAIKSADQCLDEFLGSALLLQQKLESEKATVKKGAVSKEEKEAIFRNGLLNDAATCLFIKGRSLEKLGRIEDAKATFKKVVKLNHARCWDEGQQVFWSPSEGAGGRLAALEHDKTTNSN